jgi:hypothetical protein
MKVYGRDQKRATRRITAAWNWTGGSSEWAAYTLAVFRFSSSLITTLVIKLFHTKSCMTWLYDVINIYSIVLYGSIINIILNLDIGFYSQITTVNNSPDIITMVRWVKSERIEPEILRRSTLSGSKSIPPDQLKWVSSLKF